MNSTSSQRGATGGLAASGTNAGASSTSGTQAPAVRETVSKVSGAATTVVDSAKELTSKASEKLLNSVEQQKVAGADFVSGMAGALRRASHEFGELPQAAQYIRLAADQVDSVSEAFRKRDLSQLVSDVQGFARRQPTAFLGLAVLPGFTAIRFLKTSTATSADSSATGRQYRASVSPSTTDYRSSSSGVEPR
jgi:hypothetical protein